jgi:hypothetical protein
LHFRLGCRAVAPFVPLLLSAGCDAPTFTDGFEEAAISSEKWQIDADPECQIETSNDRARDGKWSLRISAPESSRCEIVPRIRPAFQTKLLREPFGEERWYRFSVFVQDLGSPDGTEDISNNTIVAQWHSSPDPFPSGESERGPPLALRIHNGRWGITYGWDSRFRSISTHLADQWQWVGPVETGQWTDWTFRVIWSHDDQGSMEIWRDDKLVMQRSGPNTFNDVRGVYLKLGVYHPTDNQVVMVDSVQMSNQE